MITDHNFKTFEPIVLDAMEELFDYCLKNEATENDFLVFLENGHHDASFAPKGVNPFLIGQGFDGAKDYDRMAFVATYLNIPFEKYHDDAPTAQDKFDVRRNSIALSMMVYVHFWESKVFLRRLRLLAMLSESQAYDWHLNVNPTNTYTFIKNKIREVFKSKGLKIYDVIKDAYKSQVRNAFAHSDYYLSDGKVYLDNYNPNDQWSIEYISFEDFDKIIIKTLLIHHAMISKLDEYKKRLGEERADREIYVPENGGTKRTLHYRKVGDNAFRWLWENQIKK